MPTLVATGSDHCGIDGETLAVVAVGGDGEQQLARGWDCIAASLGMAQWLRPGDGSVDPDVGGI
jgi:hypothetical protein